MSVTRIGAVLGAICWVGFAGPSWAQSCGQVCTLVRTTVWTPYPQRTCFTDRAGRTTCQSYTDHRSEDRYERRCINTCEVRR
jgi:hypothetical protein